MTHDAKKWEVATDIARQIREKKNDIAGNFLWIALKAKQLKEGGEWKAVTEDWDEYCLDNETGLGMSPSYVRNLIGVIKIYIEGGLCTTEEAIKIGPHRLQLSKQAVGKIDENDHPKAVEILLGDSKISDMKAALRELVPEADRKPLDHEERFMRAISKAWTKLNDVEMENASADFILRAQDYLSKMTGYMRR